MPRLSAIIRPGIDGMNTDQPSYMIGKNESAFAQDALAPEGIIRQRRGWVYDTGTLANGDFIVGFSRNKYILTGTTVNVYGINDSANAAVRIDDGTGTLTALRAGDGDYLPRAMYRDEVYLCSQTGSKEVIRYAGHSYVADPGRTGTLVGNTGTVTPTGTFASGVGPGMYAQLNSDSSTLTYWPYMYPKVIEGGTASLTLEESYFGTTAVVDTVVSASGYTTPCISVYEAGSADFDNSTNKIEGKGVKWSGGDWGSVTTFDGVLAIGTTTNTLFGIEAVDDADTLSCTIESAYDETDVNYKILRRCPFKDVASHKGSLWGTGVAQYPNRVYVGPPGWNPSYPPGFVPPVDYSTPMQSSNADDFLMFPFDVPTPFDGDPNVAILSTPNPLLVLKRRAVHGVYGSYPEFAQELLASGPGCIDIRSAVSAASFQAWAGEEGVFAYYDGQILDLTDGKINREWRSLTADFTSGTDLPDDYCTIGEVYGHMLVHLTTSGGTTQRTYAVDVRDPYNPIWISRWTNHNARYFFSAKVDGETEELYWVGDDDKGRVMKSKGCFDGTGSYADDDDTEPVMKYHSGLNLVGAAEIEGEGLMTDLNVHANVLDTGSAAEVGVQVLHGGGISQGDSNETKVAGTITGDGVDRADRNDFEINRTGRFQQVRLETGTTTATTSKIEVPEIVCEFIDLSMGT